MPPADEPARGERPGSRHGDTPAGAEGSWRDEALSERELEVLRKIIDDRAPGLRPLVDDVLGARLLTDEELEPLEQLLFEVMDEEPDLSQNWLAADRLVGRVASQAEGFWT